MREIHHIIWKAHWIDRNGLLIAYAMRILSNLAYNIIIPLVSALAIQAIVAKNMHDVHRYAYEIIGLSISYAVMWSIGGLYISRCARIGSIWIQNQVFANYLQKDYEFYTNSYLGSLGAQAARLRDAFNTYGQIFTMTIPKQAVIIIAGILIIGWQSYLLAAITVATMLVVLGFTLWSSSWRQKYRRRTSETSSDVAGYVGDSLGLAMTVKSFAAEETEVAVLQPKLQEWGKYQFISWISTIPADIGRMVLAAAATALLLVVSAQLYLQGKISLAIVALIQLYVIKLVAATLDIAQIINSYEESMSAAYQPVKTMLIEPMVTDPEKPKRIPNRLGLELALNTVSYTYPKTRSAAVADFSLQIAPGEKIGLVGYSGSGKTTLSKLLLRFMDVDSGSIAINGVDLRNARQHDVRSLMAYVPQEPMLFHRSIYDNIAYGDPSKSKKAVMQAAELAHVDEFVQDLPEGYDTFVGERGVKLSGGQRQRVALARAILRDAPILVMDEATSALDSESEHLIQKALWELMKGRMAIVIAHRLSTIQRMDRIVVMDKGKIVQIGTHKQLLKDTDGIYARLWAHQSDGYIGSEL